MTMIPRSRRVACAVVSIAVAAVLFRAPMAEALVTRGDDALRSGDVRSAMRAYERANRIDPHATIAADRLAFFLAMRHDRASALRAIAISSDALAANGSDAALIADRGFAEMQLHAWAAAEHDFAIAGSVAHDARYDHFAARLALRRGDRHTARADARRAIASDPAFAPAYALLRSAR